MQGSWFRSSPSFIIGVVLVLGVAAAYLWGWSRPHPRVVSDRIVREFVAAAQEEVRSGRRAIERAVDRVDSSGEIQEALKAIESAAEEALRKVEQGADAALTRLEQVEGIPFKTEQNRRARIRNRLREMKEAIAEIRTDAENRVRSHAESAESR